MTRFDWQRQPGVCTWHESLQGRSRCRIGHDHRGRTNQACLPACTPRVNTPARGKQHVRVPPWRADRVIAASLPPSRWSIARARPGTHSTRIRHFPGRPCTSRGASQDRAPLATQRRRLLREYSSGTLIPITHIPDLIINTCFVALSSNIPLGRYPALPPPPGRLGAPSRPQRTHPALPGG